jgi:hypothetical protein
MDRRLLHIKKTELRTEHVREFITRHLYSKEMHRQKLRLRCITKTLLIEWYSLTDHTDLVYQLTLKKAFAITRAFIHKLMLLYVPNNRKRIWETNWNMIITDLSKINSDLQLFSRNVHLLVKHQFFLYLYRLPDIPWADWLNQRDSLIDKHELNMNIWDMWGNIEHIDF